MEVFLTNLANTTSEEELLDFCRKQTLHGTPKIFEGAEDKYYDFRKRIADKFNVYFHEVFITGSAKLGFSPFKQKSFDYDSDIDVAIISSDLYDRIMSTIQEYQMQLRENRKAVSAWELKEYHKFLEYGAIGWMRPDLLPTSFRVKELKRDWFDFSSLSYGKSEVGNYKAFVDTILNGLPFPETTIVPSIQMAAKINAVLRPQRARNSKVSVRFHPQRNNGVADPNPSTRFRV